MIVGIDLGTTNSLISYCDEQGDVHIIPSPHGRNLTPSIVNIDKDFTVTVGEAAKERLITHPETTIANAKRHIGTGKTYTVGKQTLRPEEVSSLVLKQLKQDAQAHLKQEITEAVITVPAYFNDTQRKATQAAGTLAGLKVERIINEPTAAALAYGLSSEGDDYKTVLVFDLGGGTFDISILEIFEGVIEVHASTGDNFLGGHDFTEALAKHIKSAALDAFDLKEEALTPALLESILAQAESAKKQLSSQNEADIRLVAAEQEMQTTITTEHFEKICQPLIERIVSPIERALRDAKIRARDLDDVLLVGGATKMPIIRKLATQLFGRFPSTQLDPDQVVARGAAIQAALKAKNKAMDDIVLTDVAPYTLGIETSNKTDDSHFVTGVFLPIIERNSYVPVSRVESVGTLVDGQTKLLFHVYQGESPKVKDNIKLGSLSIKIPKGPAGKEEVEVRFTYDINGVLEIETTTVSTGEKHTKVIIENKGTMTEEDIAKRLKALASLKIHPRDDAENKLLMSKLERLYQENLGDTRAMVGHYISQFEAVLNKQDKKQILEARKQLNEFLDQFEYNPF